MTVIPFADACSAAHGLRARGLFPVPIDRGRKGPSIDGWQKLRLEDSEIDVHISSSGNVGVILGTPSRNLLDVDLDCKESLILGARWLPRTGWIFGRPGKRSSHYLYLGEDCGPSVKLEEPLVHPGLTRVCLIELRAGTGGQQTLFPPSLNAESPDCRPPSEAQRLQWERFEDPGPTEYSSLLAIVKRIAAASLLARHWKDGQRHEAALALAGFFLRYSWTAAEAEEFLGGMAAAVGADERKCRAAARDTAENLKAGRPVTGGRRLREFFPDPVFKKVCEWLGLESRAESLPVWEDPIPFGRPMSLPGFPTDMLPEVVRGMVREVADERQVPEDLAGVVALGVLAACGGGAYRVLVHGSYAEPINLYVLPAMEPGERKSSTLADLTAPLLVAEQRLRVDAGPAIADAKERRAIQEERLKKLRKDSVTLKDASARAEAEHEARELARNLIELLPEPRLVAGDVTPERMAGLIAEQRGRLAVVDAEGACLFEVLAGRYSRNGEPQIETFLRAHAGDALRVDRVGRPAISVASPCLTIVATVQPDVLRGLAQKPGFRGRGVLARLLFALPVSRVGTRLFRERVPDEAARGAYGKAIEALALNGARSDGTGDLKMSTDALSIWRSESDRIERDQADGGRLAAVRDWASKLGGAIVRISGGLHLAATCGEPPELTPISGETMAAAVQLGRYFETHALAAFSLMAEPWEQQQARRLLSWIQRKRLLHFSQRDAYRDFGRGGRPADLLPGLRVLEERGYLRQTQTKREAGLPGRKPGEVFEVNPAVFRPLHESDVSDKKETGEKPHFVGNVGSIPGTDADDEREVALL